MKRNILAEDAGSGGFWVVGLEGGLLYIEDSTVKGACVLGYLFSLF